jgi:hypothetical protein
MLRSVDTNHQVVEFPANLLPSSVYVGCVLELSITVDQQMQEERLSTLRAAMDGAASAGSPTRTIAARWCPRRC